MRLSLAPGPAFAVQKRHPLDAVTLRSLGATSRLMAVAIGAGGVSGGLGRPGLVSRLAGRGMRGAGARAARGLAMARTLMRPCGGGLRDFGVTRGAAVFARQRLADQLFDVAQIRVFLAGTQRDGDAVGAGARGAADA
ncbi:MAG: hypothetical protein ACLP8B_27100, partial [Xanthobacteraceae bacterium]